MAQNPLLGKRISLISKKNIRYEGLLYSINEQNATVALQNVRSYGTEGRELTDHETTLVAPSDAVHPYLLFRGQDIKDLHVHENQTADETKNETEPAATAAKDPPTPIAPEAPTPALTAVAESNKAASAPAAAAAPPQEAPQSAPKPPQQQQQQPSQQQPSQPQQQQEPQGGRGGGNRRQRKPNWAVGTGASLLIRKERGSVVSEAAAGETKADFDFQTHNDQFAKETAENDEAGDEPVNEAVIGTYEKDDFFDSISCDALDKQSGVDNRLRGQYERQLNTETFGAVALNNSRRRSGRGGGRGRGRGGGRGGGEGRSGGGEGGRSGGRGYRGRGRGRGGGGGRSTSHSNSGAGAQQSRYSES